MSRSVRRLPGLMAACTLLAALAAAPAGAQSAGDYTDDTAPLAGKRGERIRQVLDAINSGQAAGIESLVNAAFGGEFKAIPLADHVAVLGGLHDRTRGLELHGVRRYADPGTANRVVVIAKARLTGAWHGLTIDFDGTPEERITGLQLSPARPPKNLPPLTPLTLEQAKAELASFLRTLAEAEAFSGTALLARQGEVVFEAAHGMADRNHGVPMRMDSKLNLGSMNKMFTAVVIGQLVDEGKLGFEDPVARYLGGKGWTKADLSKVRVEHLLSHTSGLGSYFNDSYDRTARHLLRRIDDYKPLVAEDTLAFEPGTKWQYSNTGFLLAGAVIEAVTGRDYFDVVRERVYARAGMTGSDSYDLDLVVPNLAIGYARERSPSGPKWRANTFAHVIRGGPAGGGYSTARDLLAFAEALRSGKLVRAATFERLWSPKPQLGSPEYGFGFGTTTDASGRRTGHSGGFAGISSSLEMDLDRGWTIVVLSNVSGGMQPVAQKMREVVGRLR